ncbi:efflux RND transporter permease subunit [Pantoea sp. PNT02]|jgi:multidrug efflux pump|nr:efflux RND transporter permease subunit [Pantoea sp. PNT02]
MAQFFIKRPVFAWVVALFIILFGIIAIPKLPVRRWQSLHFVCRYVEPP